MRKQLREASGKVGFVDPSAQQLSQLLVEVDAEILLELIMKPFDWEIRSNQDLVWLVGSVKQTFELLKRGNSILPGFSRWLAKAGAGLKDYDKHLDEAFDAASTEERKVIGQALDDISELRKQIRKLQCERGEA